MNLVLPSDTQKPELQSPDTFKAKTPCDAIPLGGVVSAQEPKKTNISTSLGTGLKLERPLITFDLETTGLDIQLDRVVEICAVKVFPDGHQELRTHRLNPEQPIAKEASLVHGISDEDVKDCPNFAKMAPDFLSFFEGSDLAGFNVDGFDLPLLKAEFARVDIDFPKSGTVVLDAWKIFLMKEPRDLSAAFRFYCGKTLKDAHTAEADALAASEVLFAQVERYEDIPNDVVGLELFCHPDKPNWVDDAGKIVFEEGVAVLSFGKHKGRSLELMCKEERSYLNWASGPKSSFSESFKNVVKAALSGEIPVPSPKP